MSTSKLTIRTLLRRRGAAAARLARRDASGSRDADEWQPLLLVALLFALSLGGQRVWFVTIRGQHLAPGLVAQVLAMSLLGPAPAVAMSVARRDRASASGAACRRQRG